MAPADVVSECMKFIHEDPIYLEFLTRKLSVACDKYITFNDPLEMKKRLEAKKIANRKKAREKKKLAA